MANKILRNENYPCNKLLSIALIMKCEGNRKSNNNWMFVVLRYYLSISFNRHILKRFCNSFMNSVLSLIIVICFSFSILTMKLLKLRNKRKICSINQPVQIKIISRVLQRQNLSSVIPLPSCGSFSLSSLQYIF